MLRRSYDNTQAETPKLAGVSFLLVSERLSQQSGY
jgi:hypothetical protein